MDPHVPTLDHIIAKFAKGLKILPETLYNLGGNVVIDPITQYRKVLTVLDARRWICAGILCTRRSLLSTLQHRVSPYHA